MACSIRPSRTDAWQRRSSRPSSRPTSCATYDSPDHVPAPWMPDRPAEIEGRQPAGALLGYQGPDQGYVLQLADRLRGRLHRHAGRVDRGRDPGQHQHRPEASLVVRPGAGDPRPHHRAHHLGLARRVARRRTAHPSPGDVRGRAQHRPSLHRGSGDRRSRPRVDAAARPGESDRRLQRREVARTEPRVREQAIGEPTGWHIDQPEFHDSEFTDAVLAQVHASQCIDPDTIWLAGFSAGSAWAGDATRLVAECAASSPEPTESVTESW